MTMPGRSVLASLALITAIPCLAQTSSVGGAVSGVGGTVGGVTGGIGGAVGGISGTGSGPTGVGGTGGGLGGLGGGLGGFGGSIGGFGSSLDPAGSLSGLSGRTVSTNGFTTYRRLTREDIRRAIDPSLAALATDRLFQEMPPESLLLIRKARLAELVRQNPKKLDFDGRGNPIGRGRLLALNPTAKMIAAARKAGFPVIGQETIAPLGMQLVTLGVPAKMRTRDAHIRLQRAVPLMTIDFDHVFEPAGGSLGLAAGSLVAASASMTGGVRIGMVDGGVGESPALEDATIEHRGFAGPAEPTGHGTAVASLLVGRKGPFRGAAPGAAVLVADIYGGDPAAGSAKAMVSGLAWLASRNVPIVNVSVVGPRNLMVERAVAAMQRRGITIVAPVGNDGPAAPPLYPASQAGVIAVTAVDSTRRAIPEAGRAAHLDYAAPGADMAAAAPGGGFADVRGTSFAAPFVTARLALTGSTTALNREAVKGYGRIGRGIVCFKCAVPLGKVKKTR